MGGIGGKARAALGAFGLLSLAGCGSLGEGASSIGDMFLLAGTTVPEVQGPALEDVYCPPVGVIEGGAALQAYSGGRVGDAGALRNQITLGQLARECAGQPDGSTLVKVGIQGRALLGAGGGAGRFDVPVRVVVKRGSTIIANRLRRVAVTIPAGDTQGTFTIIEDGIVIPPVDAEHFEIEVGLGGAGPAEGRGRRRG
jgi:hypothetical protein